MSPTSTTPPTRELFTGWGGESIDLEAYLARVGYADPITTDLTTLHGLHRAQAGSISFENLDIILDRGIDVSLPVIQDKLVRRRRGGYCYENNLLLAAVLDRVGFPVTGVSARVRMGTDAVRPATHAALLVEVDGPVPWLCDVGFGAEGLYAPIPLVDGPEHMQGVSRFRLDQFDDGEWLLSSLRDTGWTALYTFHTAPRYPYDYVVANHYTSTHPHSPFVKTPLVQRIRHLRRDILIGDTLTTVTESGRQDRQISIGELPHIVRDTMNIAFGPSEMEQLTDAVMGVKRD